MAFEDTKELDLAEIQQKFNISQKIIDNLVISKSELDKIYRNFQANSDKFEKMKAEILSILNENLSGKVHSIRCRIKDSDHLVEKIIRNTNQNPDKYADISIENYYKIITLYDIKRYILRYRSELFLKKDGWNSIIV